MNSLRLTSILAPLVFLILSLPVCAAEPRTLEDALTTHEWSLYSPEAHWGRWTKAQFKADGSVMITLQNNTGNKHVDTWKWKIVSPRTLRIKHTVRGNLLINDFKVNETWNEFTSIGDWNGAGGLRNDASAESPQLNAVATQAMVIDPKQPLLETFSQLVPNASAWVLAALNEGVPPNVRQNLSYLREDMLDEYQKQPKASQETYKLAHQICTSMIAALDERNQTLVRAGYRAVQADAAASTPGSQALNARRNYMMSWPQYAREEDQRTEQRNAAVNKALVTKELPKVEWSNRTATLRKTLDNLYAKFREALRQSSAEK